ncbi:hypothetical protein DAI22_07g086801 [Oryza sativa Japonica Group]|nr:hypothetical protein DAI22_07g086801 [Oryza sativa Japonica Group]
MAAPSSPTISFLTASATRSRSNTSPSSSPTPHWCVTYLAFTVWSPKHGCASMGTPSQMLSSVEFHPQCVQNPPIAGTSLCGAHVTTFPMPLSTTAVSGSVRGRASETMPVTKPGRMTQRNGTPLPASPRAISSNTSRSMRATLPRLTYSTDRGECACSHATQPLSGACRPCSSGAPSSLCIGPMANAGILGRWRRMFRSTGFSMARKVLITKPIAAVRMALSTRAMNSRTRSASPPSTRIRSRPRSGSTGGNTSQESDAMSTAARIAMNTISYRKQLAFDREVAGVAEARVAEHAVERGGVVGAERERGDADLRRGGERRVPVPLPVDHRARHLAPPPPPPPPTRTTRRSASRNGASQAALSASICSTRSVPGSVAASGRRSWMGTKMSSGWRAASGALKVVRTTVTARPRPRRSSASWSIGAMWLRNGNGNITTRRQWRRAPVMAGNGGEL